MFPAVMKLRDVLVALLRKSLYNIYMRPVNPYIVGNPIKAQASFFGRQLEKQLAHAGEFTPVYFDLQDKAAKSLPEVLFELSQHISKVTGQAAAKSSDFNSTSDYFRSTFLPEVAQKVAKASLKVFGADGITIQQFNESAGGQVVFHLHVHVIPRHDGVPMKPPATHKEKPEVLAAHAAKLSAACLNAKAACAKWMVRSESESSFANI